MVYTHSYTGAHNQSREPLHIPKSVSSLLEDDFSHKFPNTLSFRSYSSYSSSSSSLPPSSSSSSSLSPSHEELTENDSLLSLSFLPPTPEIIVFCEKPRWKNAIKNGSLMAYIHS